MLQFKAFVSVSWSMCEGVYLFYFSWNGTFFCNLSDSACLYIKFVALKFVLLGFDSVSIQESEFCVAVKWIAVMDTYIAEK
jgi:hypothetical protein